jgi:hypothetical protein
MDHIAAVSAWRHVANHVLDQFKEAIEATMLDAAVAGSNLSCDLMTRCAKMILEKDPDITVRDLMRSCSVFPFRRNVERLHLLNGHLTVDNFPQHFSQHPEYAEFFRKSTIGQATGTCDKYLNDSDSMLKALECFQILRI